MSTQGQISEIFAKIADINLRLTEQRQAAGTTHNLLSATHPDTVVASPVRGDLITGQGASPEWKRLAIGAAGVLGSDGTDILWLTAIEGIQKSGSNLKLNINGLTEDATPDENADFVATWDVSASVHKKVKLSNLPGGGAGGVPWQTFRKSERYYTHWDSYSLTTYTLSADYIYAIPFIVPVEQNFDRIALYVYAAANRVVRLGIYGDDGDIYPGSLIHGTAELDCSSSDCKEEIINETLTPGLYWLAVLNGVVGGNVRATYYQYSSYAVRGRTACNDLTPPVSLYKSQAYGAMPDPFPAAASESDTNLPAIMLRKS